MSKRTRNVKRRRGSNKRSNRRSNRRSNKRSNKRSNRKSKQLCGSYKKPYWGKDDCICEKGKKSKVHIGTRSEGWACIDHDCKKVKKYFKKPKTGPGHQWFLPIYGIPEKENKIYKNVEYNVFEDVPSKLPKGYNKATTDTIIFILMMIELFIIVVETYFIRNIIKFMSHSGLILPYSWVSRSSKMERLIESEYGGSIFVGYIIFLFSDRLNEKLIYFASRMKLGIPINN